MNQAKWLNALSSLLIGLAVLLFFALCYPHHLHFQEQYQLFLFDLSYLTEILRVPGGVADAMGRFFTQFFLLAWVGAGIMACVIGGVVWLSCRRLQPGWLYGLGLLPGVALFLFLCDESALLGAAFALLLTLLAEWGLSAVVCRWLRLALRLLSAPVLYWALGPVAVLSPLLAVVQAVRQHGRADLLVAVLAVVLCALMPLLAQQMVTVSLQQLCLSPHYYRYPLVVPRLLWVAAGCVLLLAVLPPVSAPRWTLVASWLLVASAGGVAVSMTYNPLSEEVMSYDYMARFQQWNNLLRTAQLKAPNNPVSCTVLNLALGMKGQLADRMFDYRQRGLDGLLPSFVRDHISPLATAEAFYQLGMINTAQRFVFEAQEAIPDFQKSGRCYKRLAQTNLICGNYPVARKYLHALTKTLFYRTWALETLALLADSSALRQHSEYGRLRQFMPSHDCWFSDQETPQMLGQLFLANRSNRLAFEYLEASYLLLRDLNSFVRCLELSSSLGYLQLPRSYQQGLILWWSRDHTAQDPLPAGVSQNYVIHLNQFFTEVKKPSASAESLRARFGATYWHYYFY